MIGTVKEFRFTHKILAPPHVGGVVGQVKPAGSYTVEEPVVILEDGTELKMYQTWPVRHSRPVREKLDPTAPFLTGMRILDVMFPVAMGGNAAIPGPFGSGKTVTQQSLAKWSNADIVLYVGCDGPPGLWAFRRCPAVFPRSREADCQWVRRCR